MSNIHPTAVIGKNVQLGENVVIHPYAVLDGKAEIGDNCEIGPFVHITGWVKIGTKTKIYSSAAIGEDPQDYTFDGTPGLVEIGSECLIREGVTIHTPIKGNEGQKTIVGNHVFMMANSHAAHNVKIADHAVLANGVLLAGFVEVQENVFISGNVGVHQFCRVGAYSIVSVVAKVAQDIPPYCMAEGNPAVAHGLNIVGLRRNNFNQEQRNKIKDAYKILYSGTTGRREALDAIEAKYRSSEEVMRLVRFCRESKRGFVSGHVED